MSYAPNNRQYPRRAAYIIAEYTVLEGTHHGIIRNIGAGGMFIKTKRKIAVGQLIQIKSPLYDFDQVVEASGRVVRLDHDGIAVTFDEAIHGLICKEGHFPEIVHEKDRPASK